MQPICLIKMLAAVSNMLTCCCNAMATSAGGHLGPLSDLATSNAAGSDSRKQFCPLPTRDKSLQANSGRGAANSHTGDAVLLMEAFRDAFQQRDNALNWVVSKYRFTTLLPSKRLTNELSRNIFWKIPQ